MDTKSSAVNKVSSFVIGLAILLPGLFFMVLGVTFLPVIGLIMGLPIMALSIGFMMVSLKQDTEALSVQESPAAASEMLETASSQPEIIQLPLPETGGATALQPPTWKEAA